MGSSMGGGGDFEVMEADSTDDLLLEEPKPSEKQNNLSLSPEEPSDRLVDSLLSNSNCSLDVGNENIPIPGPSTESSANAQRSEENETAQNDSRLKKEEKLKITSATICQVCEDSASGVHFGVWTCEGCKGFFKRAQLPTGQMKSYVCHQAEVERRVRGGRSSGVLCPISARTRNTCRACRLMKCIAVGMSRDEIKLGRRRKHLEQPRSRFSHGKLPRGPSTSSFSQTLVKQVSPVSGSTSADLRLSTLKIKMDFSVERAGLAVGLMKQFCVTPSYGTHHTHTTEISSQRIFSLIEGGHKDLNSVVEYMDWSGLIPAIPEVRESDFQYEVNRIQIMCQMQTAAIHSLLLSLGLNIPGSNPNPTPGRGTCLSSTNVLGLTQQNQDTLRADMQGMMLALSFHGITPGDSSIISRTEHHSGPAPDANQQVNQLYGAFIPAVMSCCRELDALPTASVGHILLILLFMTCREKLRDNPIVQSEEVKRYFLSAIGNLTQDSKLLTKIRYWREYLKREQLKALESFSQKPPSLKRTRSDYPYAQTKVPRKISLPPCLEQNIAINKIQMERSSFIVSPRKGSRSLSASSNCQISPDSTTAISEPSSIYSQQNLPNSFFYSGLNSSLECHIPPKIAKYDSSIPSPNVSCLSTHFQLALPDTTSIQSYPSSSSYLSPSLSNANNISPSNTYPVAFQLSDNYTSSSSSPSLALSSFSRAQADEFSSRVDIPANRTDESFNQNTLDCNRNTFPGNCIYKK